MRGNTLHDGDDLAMHYDDAMIAPLGEALDDHDGMLGGGDGKCSAHFIDIVEAPRDAAAVVGIEWLEQHREAQLLGNFHGAFESTSDGATGCCNADALE